MAPMLLMRFVLRYSKHSAALNINRQTEPI